MTKFESLICRTPPFSFIIRKSKNIYLPGFEGIVLYEVGEFFFKQLKKLSLIERAAAISFNLIMALPAAVLFLFSIVPYLPGSDNFKTQILGLFKDLTPNSNTYKFIETLLNDLFKKHVGVFSSGFVLLIFYSSNAMIGIIRTFDRSIQENKVFFLHKRWRAIKLTTILILLLIASTLVLIGQQELMGLLKSLFNFKRRTRLPWWNGVRWVIIFAFLFYGIAFVYKFAPSVQKRWRLLSPGSIFATVFILLATLGFSYWVNNFAHYNKIYGSIGTVLILMILINFNALILLIGFEINVSIMTLKKQRDNRLNELVNNSF